VDQRLQIRRLQRQTEKASPRHIGYETKANTTDIFVDPLGLHLENYYTENGQELCSIQRTMGYTKEKRHLNG
jgi:hypothetical protein